MKKITLTILLFFLVIVKPAPVGAQGINISIQTPISQIEMVPGGQSRISLTFENHGDPFFARFVPTRVVPSGISGEMVPALELGPIEFKIEKGNINEPFLFQEAAKKNINLVVNTAKNIRSGDYYYAIILKSIPQNFQEPGVSAYISSGIGSILVVNILSEEAENLSLSISEFLPKTRASFVFFGQRLLMADVKDNIPIRLVVYNPRDHLVSIGGNVSISGKIKKADLIPLRIMAQSSRILKTQQNYSDSSFSYVISGFNIGKKTIVATVIDQDKKQIQKSVIIYFFPFKLFAAIMIVSFILYILAINFKKNSQV